MKRTMKILRRLFIVVILQCISIAAANAGIVRGKVTDMQTKEPLTGSTIQVEGRTIGAVADLDGSYTLDLPKGSYKLIVNYIGYQQMVQQITVDCPEQLVNFEMRTDSKQLAEVSVVAQKNRENEMALLMDRQKAILSLEYMGSKEMAVKGISTVQEGVKKVTGISIADAGQLIVRGLGDRYSITTLNGMPIASPNPDNKLVPLDLFPSTTVQNIAVSKVYDAADYADYSGAHIEISTKERVDKDFLNIGLKMGGKFNTLGKDSYQMDRDGSLFRTPSIDSKALHLPLVEYDEYVKSHNVFNSTFAVEKKSVLPDMGADISIGKNIALGEQTLSLLGSFCLSNGYQNMEDAFYKTLESTGNIQNDFHYDSYEQELKMAALGHISYTLRQSDRLGYTFFYARNASDTYEQKQGIDSEGHHLTGSNNSTHIYTLQNHQISGLHNLTTDTRWQIDWSASYAKTSSEEPDRRQIMFNNEDGKLSLFKLNRQETMRYFGELSEEEWNARLSLKWGWNDTDHIRVGIDYKDKSRNYMGTRFYYNINRLNPTITNIYNTNGYMNQENIANGNIVIERKMQPKDSYLAGNEIYAAYLIGNLHPFRNFQMNVGVRYESSRQWVRYATDGGEKYGQRRNLEKNDLFPTLNIKYTLNTENSLRLSASRTITRPSFIEMAPFLYQESYGSAQIRGNEALQNGYNYNFDLRYELVRQGGDMLSITAYYKYLDSPIERIQALQGGATLHSFQNADNGMATGIEIEARKLLLKNLRIGTNVSYMYTNVALPEGGAYTNKERSLQGASPILLNADVTWSPSFNGNRQLNMALLYNLQGKRIHAVGVSGLGDIKQQAMHTLNFNLSYKLNKHLTLKMQVDDILNRDVVFKQEIPQSNDEMEVERYRKGIGLEFGISCQL